MSQQPPDPIPFPRQQPGVQPDPRRRPGPPPQRPPQQAEQPSGPVIYSASGQPMRRVAPAQPPRPANPPPPPAPLQSAPPPAGDVADATSLHGHVAAVIDSTDATFQKDVIERSHELPVVVDCWAPWCGPCRILGPILEKLAYERDGQVQLVKVNTDENPQVARALQVQGIPAVFAFAGGAVINQFVGALPEEQVREFFDSLIPSEADLKAAEGYRMLQENQVPIARLHFESALEENPDHEPAGVGLAAVLAGIGETERALSLARRWPNNPTSKGILASMELRTAMAGYDPAEVRQAAATMPESAEARYRHGCLLALEGQWQAALDELLESVRLDRYAADEGARKRLLDLFALLGENQPVVAEYRRRLGQLLF